MNLKQTTIFILLGRAGLGGLSAQEICEWDKDGDGFWTTSASQFDPEVNSNWDCPGVPPFTEINFPHNFSPVGPYFKAKIDGEVSVTVGPVLPIAISFLEIGEGSSVALVDGSDFYVQNTGSAGMVDNAGLITMDNLIGALSTSMSLDGQVRFDGGGSVLLGGAGNAIGGASAFNFSSTMIIGDQVVEGAGSLGSESLSIRVESEGVVRASQALEVLEIDPGADNNVVNQGLLEALGNGTLRLKETAVNNAGGLINAATGSLVELQEVTLFSGEMTGGGVVRGISNVTLEGPLTNSGTYAVANGTATQLDGTLTNTGQVTISGGSFLAKTPSVFDGGGTITLAAIPGSTSTLGAVFDSGATLDNQDNLIQGGGNINGPLTNSSTVRADEADAPLRLLSPSINLAAMEATSGGELNVRAALTNDGASVEAVDGSVSVTNGGSIIGGTVTVRGGSELRVADGSVSEGSVNCEGGGTVRVSQFISNRVSGDVTIFPGGEFTVDDNAGVILDAAGLYQNAGTIKLDGEGVFASFANSSLRIDGEVSLAGGGEVVMSNSSKNVIITAGFAPPTLVNLDNTIRGSGQLGRSTMNFDNRAIIDADQSPTAEAGTGLLSLDPTATFKNSGVLRASAGTLELRDGTFLNDGGVIEASGAGSVRLLSAAEIIGGRIAGPEVRITSDAVFDGTEGIVADALATVETTGRLLLIGSIENRGHIQVEGSGQLRCDGVVTLTGGGEISLNAPASRLTNFPGALPGDRIVNVDNRISGSGAIQFIEIENGGTLAPGNSPGTMFTGSLTQTSGGVIEIEIAGANAGEYDVLNVQGIATLGGTLRVLPLPGLDVPAGTTFDILLSGGISGSFDNIEIPLSPEGQPMFTLSQVGNTLRLTAGDTQLDPEPYGDWASAQGLDETNNDPGDDPNDDGLDNLGAYVLGVPALGSTTGGSITTEADDQTLTIQFRSPGNVTGVNIGTETSGTMTDGSWLPGPDPEVVDFVDGYFIYEATLPVTVDKNFIRLTFATAP